MRLNSGVREVCVIQRHLEPRHAKVCSDWAASPGGNIVQSVSHLPLSFKTNSTAELIMEIMLLPLRLGVALGVAEVKLPCISSYVNRNQVNPLSSASCSNSAA